MIEYINLMANSQYSTDVSALLVIAAVIIKVELLYTEKEI